MLKDSSLVKKVSILLAGVSLFIILSMGIILYLKFNAVITEQVIEDQEHTLRNSKVIMDEFIGDIADTLWDLTMNKNVADILKKTREDPMTIIMERQEISNLIALSEDKFIEGCRITMFVNEEVPFAKHLFQWNGDKSLNDEVIKGVFNNVGMKELNWYKKALGGKDRIISHVSDDGNFIYFIKASQNPFLRLKSYKYEYDEEYYTNVMIIGIPSNLMQERVKTLHAIKDSVIQIYNENNEVLYTYTDIDNQVLSEDAYMSVMEKLANGWYVKASIPLHHIEKQTNFVKRYIGLVTVLIIVAILISALWISKHVTKPILDLAHKMKQTRFPMKVPDNTIYNQKHHIGEVGILYSSYDRMNKQLKESLEIQREAEYQALQAQINPHFFYNTLDSINWLALCNGQDHIADMTSTLSDILRYSIREPNKPVNLAEELQHVKEYVFIEDIHYKQAFKMHYDVQPLLDNYQVPKFILQPLVENAIKHGVMKKREGHIYIRSKVKGEALSICIEDTGQGADVDKLNNYLQGNKGELLDSDGIGIMNVHERIKAYYGNDYGLYYYNNTYGGVTAEIMLPYEQ